MPELPEVEHVRRYLRANLVGRRLRARSRFERVEDVERRGKLVLVRLEGRRTLAFHLKMTGKLWVRERGAPPDRWTRKAFALDGGGELRFEDQRRFGWVRLLRDEAAEALAAPLGPDAWLAGEREIAAAYAARRGRVKPVLLDQTVVAGVGNIYADEILWRARIHPATRLGALGPTAIRRLARATRAVMKAAVGEREGRDVPDQRRVGGGDPTASARLRLKVYQRAGRPCARRSCRAPIVRVMLGGRSTFFCPRCQRPPPPPGRRPIDGAAE